MNISRNDAEALFYEAMRNGIIKATKEPEAFVYKKVYPKKGWYKTSREKIIQKIFENKGKYRTEIVLELISMNIEPEGFSIEALEEMMADEGLNIPQAAPKPEKPKYTPKEVVRLHR